MCKNKRFIGVVVFAVCAGLVSSVAGDAARAPVEFEGRFELYGSLTVGIATGSADYPELVRIVSVSFNTRYGNAWGVTARVGWLPVKETTWRLTVELLDEAGRVLRHSRDNPTVFLCKACTVNQSNMRYADLDLGAMHDQGRRHAARFRVRLKPSQEHVTGEDGHTLKVVVVDRGSREFVSDATVIVTSSYQQDTFRRYKTLYCTDSQGSCRIKLACDKLIMTSIEAQKQGYCTIHKSWSNSGSWGIDRAPLVNLPERHVLEMVHASALGGIIRDSHGQTIEGVEVHLEALLEEPSGTINVNRSVRTDASGRWRIEGIPIEADRIDLRLRHAEYGDNNGRDRLLTADALVNARAFKNVEILDKGLVVTGKVLDDWDKPIAGATVLPSLRSVSHVYAVTNTDGMFRLACSSNPSDYLEASRLIVETPGYAPVQQALDLPSKPEGLEFHLKRGRNITCRVLSTEEKPVVGAWTVVQPFEDNRDYSVWLENTDDRGEFQIPNVPQSDVKLTIGKQGYIAIRDLIVAASEKDIVVTMKRAMRIHGAVMDTKTGKAIPHFEIAVMYESGGRTRTSSPVAFTEGTYEVSFDEAEPETRQLQVSAVGYESATSDQIKVDEGERVINFKLARSASFNQATAGRPRKQIKPAGLRRITGIVRDQEGKPVPDAVVRTCPWLGAEAITNAKGAFTLRSRINEMREETMYLLARQKERNLGVAVEIDPSTDNVDVTLTPGVILVGEVVDVEGKGVPSAELSLTFWTSSIGYGMREATEIDKEGRYEIQAVPPGHKYSVNASANGYGERYVRVDTSGATNERIEIKPLVLSVANLSVSGIVVDNFDQPVSGIRIYAYGNGQPSRETFTDEKGQFTIENICPGPLNIQANSQRQAARRFRGRARVEGGATDIKILASEVDERGRSVPSRPPSLVGKTLPDLKNVGINLSLDDIKGKRILVCFWDMNQRPSRHCMTQLVKRIETLKQKDILIAAVQASKADRDALDEWKKKYNISLISIVERDVKKVRFKYGVQLMPWLILTDTKHVVRAEGFALNELEAKLKQINGD